MQHARTFMLALLVAVIAALVPTQALAGTVTTSTTGAKAAATSRTHTSRTSHRAPTSAKASSNSIVQSCKNHGDSLPGHYNLNALKQAYGSIPVAVREYTTCAQVIFNKITEESPHIKVNGGTKNGGGGFPVIIVLVVVVLLLGGGGAFYSYRRSRGNSAQ